MNDCLIPQCTPDCVPILLVAEKDFDSWLEQQAENLRCWLKSTDFKAKPGNFSLIPDAHHHLQGVLVSIADVNDIWALGELPASLPEGDYYLDTTLEPEQCEQLTLGWVLGAYHFTRYQSPKRSIARLALAPGCDIGWIQNHAEAITLTRDLINTPAEDMMPEHLAEVAQTLAQSFGASMKQTVDQALLTDNFPTIYAVGRASTHPPRLLDLQWGDPSHPKVTLVGKGVCFDSGGLDLKPPGAMRLMKKDMGGAATALGLARLIMSASLPLRLRVLIPAVENAVAGNAFHPGDIITSRQGTTIEIHNTDAEGRLILCDALAEACTEQPDMLIDFATLTGAARVALGADIPAMFCNDEALAAELLAAAQKTRDPIWRLPLHQPYRRMLDSPIADIANASTSPYAGSLTAALFLKEFVAADIPWVHIDLMGWNLKTQPGRPEGGEAMGLRAVFASLQQRYGT